MQTKNALSPTAQPFPPLSDRQIWLALYALASALEPSGVFVEVDTTDLSEEIANLHPLTPADRYHYALTMLTTLS